MTIYLDYQSTTPLHPDVSNKMSKFWSLEYGNPHSSEHFFGWKASQAVDKARREVAELLGAFEEEVIFTSGATEANNIAILGHSESLRESSRKVVLCGSTEHKCVYEASRRLANITNSAFLAVPVDKCGQVNFDFLEKNINSDTYILSLMLVNNEIGAINDIKKAYEICQKHGVLLHCDASQATTVMDLSWLADCADSISISGHKMYAPMGIGALSISPYIASTLCPLVFGGGQERGLRSGTLPVPLCVGLGAACELMSSEGFRTEISRVSKLRDEFYWALINSDLEIKLNGPELEYRHKTNLNISFTGINAKEILDILQPGLCASSGAACSSAVDGPSETLSAIGLSLSEANSSLRFSFGLSNTVDDVNAAIDAVSGAVTRLSVPGLTV